MNRISPKVALGAHVLVHWCGIVIGVRGDTGMRAAWEVHTPIKSVDEVAQVGRHNLREDGVVVWASPDMHEAHGEDSGAVEGDRRRLAITRQAFEQEQRERDPRENADLACPDASMIMTAACRPVADKASQHTP